MRFKGKKYIKKLLVFDSSIPIIDQMFVVWDEISKNASKLISQTVISIFLVETNDSSDISARYMRASNLCTRMCTLYQVLINIAVFSLVMHRTNAYFYCNFYDETRLLRWQCSKIKKRVHCCLFMTQQTRNFFSFRSHHNLRIFSGIVLKLWKSIKYRAMLLAFLLIPYHRLIRFRRYRIWLLICELEKFPGWEICKGCQNLGKYFT